MFIPHATLRRRAFLRCMQVKKKSSFLKKRSKKPLPILPFVCRNMHI